MIFRRSEVMTVAAFLVVLVVAGTGGYMVIEGWSLADAFYMTVITITAVGYHEVHPLSAVGREWTVVMLAGGITALGMWFAVVTASMVRLDIHNTYRKRKTMKRIAGLEGHIIICGGGTMGRQLLHELASVQRDCVFIERDEQAVAELTKLDSGVLVVQDDATDDDVLTRAGITAASGLVTCLSADTDNLYICLSARHLNPDLVVVARADGEQTVAKMYRAGANHVVSPNRTGAVWVASLLVNPTTASFLEVTAKGHHTPRHIEHATVGANSEVAGLTLREADIPNRIGLVVVAIRSGDQDATKTSFNPTADTRIHVGDDLIVLGSDDQLVRLRAYVG